MNSHSLLRRFAILAVAVAALFGGEARASGFTWENTFQDALNSATLRERPVVLVFTGSDWSPRSIKLEQEIFSNTEFAAWFGKTFSPCNADFPQRRPLPDATLTENTSLAMKFNVKHFPTLVALRPDGTEFARLEYNAETLAQMTAIVKSWLTRFEDPASAAAASAPGASQDTVAR
jgi:hypothetical protein